MKKIIIVIIAIMLLGAGLLLISKKSSKLNLLQITQRQEKTPSLQETKTPSSEVLFDTSDNLDQALQDLDQLDQVE